MNNKISIALVSYAIITTALLIYLAVKNEPTFPEIKADQDRIYKKIEELSIESKRLSKNIETLKENEKDTVKYYYTIDRSIVDLDRDKQSSLFTTNTKELLQKERQGYFNITQ